MNERSELSRIDRLVMRLRKDVEFTHNVTGASVKNDIRTHAADAIEAMQHWIREQGKQSNTCTRSVLGIKENYQNPRARIEIRQNIAPEENWHWAVICDNGHCYFVSDSFADMDSAIADAAVNGGLTLRRAMLYGHDA